MLKRHIKHIDYWLVAVILALSLFGLVMVYSASYPLAMLHYDNDKHFLNRQWISLLIGLVMFTLAAIFPYQKLRVLTPALIIGSIFLLVLVLVPGIGVERNFSQRWLSIGPFMFQPSEAVKLTMILYFAHVYAKKQNYIDDFKNGVLPPLVIMGIVFFLILSQPDLGTATSILMACGCILFCSGVRMAHLIGLGTIALAGITYFALSASYRLQRVLSFRDPFEDASGSGYQLINSYEAIAYGGLSGNGLGGSIQKLGFLPEAHTDFIMSIILEELGVAGLLFMVAAYVFIMYRGVRISLMAKDPFLKLLAIGLTFQIMIQVLFNLGAVSGLLPITGITLPYISYGGSSLIFMLISSGVLVNLSAVVNKTKAIQHKLN